MRSIPQLLLKTQYYLPFLDQQDQDRLLQATRRKSRNQPLYVLKQMAIKVLRQLQQLLCFQGEMDWQAAFTEYLSQLNSPTTPRRQLGRILCQADDLIEIAYVTQEIRQTIRQTARQQSLLSEEFEQHYSEITKMYLAHNETLATLENDVKKMSQEYSQSTGKTDPPALIDQGLQGTLPHELPRYSKKSIQTRFSAAHVQHLVQVEDNARIVYQGLAQELMQKPLAEKLTQAVDSAQQRLNTKAQQILKNAGALHQKIDQDSRGMIERRSQTMMAHANRMEQLILSLEKIIQTLNTYLSEEKLNNFSNAQKRTLAHLVDEAQETQQEVEQFPNAVDAARIQSKILKIEQHRQSYEKSLGGWGSFFSKNSPVAQKKEKINEALKANIAELVIPACGLFDRQDAVSHQQIKKQQQWMEQLKEAQKKVDVEKEKIQEIKITHSC